MAAIKNLFVHTELHTDDPAKAKKFYKHLFAWKMTDLKTASGGTYTMINTGSRVSAGGIQKQLKAGAPAAWLSYIEVADVKRTIAKAEKLGAKILVPFHPMPKMGALGVLVDPTGAELGIWESAKKTKKPVKKTRK